MAVTVTNAAQMADGYRKLPIEDHAKLRFMYGKITQGVAAGDAGSSVVIGKLPPGRVRVIPYLSRYKVSALGAARVMDIGHDLYYDRTEDADAGEAAAAAVFANDIDVSGATDALFPVTAGLKFDMFSRDGITLRATVAGGTIPAAATFEFNIAYLYE